MNFIKIFLSILGLLTSYVSNADIIANVHEAGIQSGYLMEIEKHGNPFGWKESPVFVTNEVGFRPGEEFARSSVFAYPINHHNPKGYTARIRSFYRFGVNTTNVPLLNDNRDFLANPFSRAELRLWIRSLSDIFGVEESRKWSSLVIPFSIFMNVRAESTEGASSYAQVLIYRDYTFDFPRGLIDELIVRSNSNVLADSKIVEANILLTDLLLGKPAINFNTRVGAGSRFNQGSSATAFADPVISISDSFEFKDLFDVALFESTGLIQDYGILTLIPGLSITDSVLQRSWKYYKVSPNSEDTSVTVELTGLSSDLDLYIKQGNQPSTSDYDCKSNNREISEEKCTLTFSNQPLYIGVYGYSNGSFTIKAILQSTDSETTIADAVFNDIEDNYSHWFSPTQLSQTQDKYYYRFYSNGSYLMEWNGGLWYNIEGSGWNKWGAIINWNL